MGQISKCDYPPEITLVSISTSSAQLHVQVSYYYGDLWPCLSCPAWRRGSMVWRRWLSRRTRSYRRWSWWAAPSDYHWPLQTHSGRCRHLHHEPTHQSQHCVHVHHKPIIPIIKIILYYNFIIKTSFHTRHGSSYCGRDFSSLRLHTLYIIHAIIPFHLSSHCVDCQCTSSLPLPPSLRFANIPWWSNFLILTSSPCWRTSVQWPCWDRAARGGGRCPEPGRGWNFQKTPWC